jgi:hypothetical protein
MSLGIDLGPAILRGVINTMPLYRQIILWLSVVMEWLA